MFRLQVLLLVLCSFPLLVQSTSMANLANLNLYSNIYWIIKALLKSYFGLNHHTYTYSQIVDTLQAKNSVAASLGGDYSAPQVQGGQYLHVGESGIFYCTTI